MLVINTLFTDILDLSAEEIVGLYRKCNWLDHFLRTVNITDIIFPVHNPAQKKRRVHMLISLLVFIFMALIYSDMYKFYESVSLSSTIGIIKDIMAV